MPLINCTTDQVRLIMIETIRAHVAKVGGSANLSDAVLDASIDYFVALTAAIKAHGADANAPESLITVAVNVLDAIDAAETH